LEAEKSQIDGLVDHIAESLNIVMEIGISTPVLLQEISSYICPPPLPQASIHHNSDDDESFTFPDPQPGGFGINL
jgi:hypothetical protein